MHLPPGDIHAVFQGCCNTLRQGGRRVFDLPSKVRRLV
jgi:hypothetical protein